MLISVVILLMILRQESYVSLISYNNRKVYKLAIINYIITSFSPEESGHAFLYDTDPSRGLKFLRIY